MTTVVSAHPFPALIRYPARIALRLWSWSGVRNGYAYMAVERYGRRLARGPLDTRLVDGSRITCRLDEHIQRHMYFFGAYEPIETYLFRVLVGPGMTVVDLGANVGQYTLLAARAVGPTGRVHAFEPVPANFEQLSAHVAANGIGDRVRLNRAAAWSHADTLTLYLDALDAADNKTDFTVGRREHASQIIQVPAISLDEYADEATIRRVDVVKLDIEGAELFALRGMSRILARDQPILFLEVNRHNSAVAGYASEEVADYLQGLGYRFWEIGGSPETSGPRRDFLGLDRGNFICHVADLPSGITSGWSYKRILRGLKPSTRPATHTR